MSEWTQADVDRIRRKVNAVTEAAKPSKYKNVKTEIKGEVFDSKREAAYWMGLRAREAAGEIEALRRQVAFDLKCPDGHMGLVVSRYIADFVFRTTHDKVYHVVDAKGHRTAVYQLKKKWLELQSGFEIEEV